MSLSSLITLLQATQAERVTQRVRVALQQRCSRCRLVNDVEVTEEGRGTVAPHGWDLSVRAEDVSEGQDAAWRQAQRNARVSLFLSRCVACGKRGRLAFPVAGLLALPWLVLAALVGWLLAVAFVARLSDAWLGSAGAALLVLGYSTASRLARADNAVKPG